MTAKKLLSLILCIVVALTVFPAMAHADEADFVIEDGVLTAYNGEETDVVIPDGVTAIGKNSLKSRKLTSVTIPSSVKRIESSAFYGNSSLKEVNFSEGLEYIGTYVFDECYCTELALVIPESVTKVDSGAFGVLGEDARVSVTFLNSETEIANNAFEYYAKVDILGTSGSTAQKYVEKWQTEKGDGCRLTFKATDVTEVTGLTLSGSSIALETGSTVVLKATTQPSEANAQITWTSSDESVATVNGEGKVTAVAPGEVDIIAAADNGVSAVCKVTVKEAPPKSDFVIEDGVLVSYSGSDETVIIPSDITAIGKGNSSVFGNTVKSVTIPAGVTTISQRAFYNVKGLESILVDEANTTYQSYDGALYTKDGKTLVCSPAAKSGITFLEGVEAIGDTAFAYTAIRQLTIPGTVKTIGESAFFYAEDLKTVTLQEGLERIEKMGFSQTRISGITIPSTVKYVGSDAFDFEYQPRDYVRMLSTDAELDDNWIPYYYGGLVLYAEENSTASSWYNKFKESKGEGCKIELLGPDKYLEATAITIHAEQTTMHRQETQTLTVESAPENAKHTGITWQSSDPKVASIDRYGKVTALDQGTTNITASAGTLKTTLTIEVVIDEEESDFTIDEDGRITGFIGTDWTKLEIPAKISGISVTGIADEAFKGRTGIEEVVLPESVKTIGASAFASCTKLSKINLENVTTLSEGSFSGCGGLTKVTLSNELTNIPKEVFRSTGLTKIEIPGSAKELGESAFSGCTRLKNIELGEGIEVIHNMALYNVPVKSLELPASFKQLGDRYVGDPFEEAGKSDADPTMKNIYVADDNPLFSEEDGILYNKDKTEVIFCPRGRVSATIPEGVTKTGSYSFFMCFQLKSVDLPSTLKTVGNASFQYDEEITRMELPEGLEVVEKSAFFGCENWTGVDRIPSTVREIGEYGFAECLGKVLTIPEGVTRIEEFAFWGYEDGLEEIHLPSTLTYIANSAFSWCKALKELTIPEGVTYIGNEAFARADSLTSVTLPSTLTEIGRQAFMGPTESPNQLKSIYIPSSVKTFGDDVFKNREATLIIQSDSEQDAAAEYAKTAGIQWQKYAVQTPDQPTKPDSPASPENPAAPSKTVRVKKNASYKVSGQTVKVTSVATAKKQGTVTFTKAKNIKSVSVPKTVKLADGKNYKVTGVAAKAFTGKKVRTVTIGANVKKISSNAFASSKATKVIVRTKLLKKASVKGSLKGSKVKTLQVKIGSKKVNKTYIKKYGKIFTKKNAGRKVAVK